MSSVRLQWASAEVEDARLTVPLEGDLPKGWKESFERTVALLGDGQWGAVELKKRTVQVSDVTPGAEDKLRHHLEGIVAQANADHEESESDEDGEADGDGKEPEGPDAQMAAEFRSFAPEEDDDA